MVSLIETYREQGFEPATSELPDHLPVLLEFLATRPLPEAQETLADDLPTSFHAPSDVETGPDPALPWQRPAS